MTRQPTLEELTEVIGTGDAYMSVTMMPSGSHARAYFNTNRGDASYLFTRPDLVRVHDALGRLLKLTATSLNDAVDRERGVTT